jgi:hypothetical protein
MKSRSLGGLIVVLLALGAFATATATAAAKPKLWLTNAGTHSHATVGEAARFQLSSENCVAREAASLASNGKPVDRIAGSGALAPECYGGKMVGTIKSVAVAPATEGQMTMTVSDIVHVSVEPWCTYTFPHSIAFPEFIFTEMVSTITATLDKGASFGSCAPTREIGVHLIVEQVSEAFPYTGEAVG